MPPEDKKEIKQTAEEVQAIIAKKMQEAQESTSSETSTYPGEGATQVGPLDVVRTYSSDMADALKKEQASVVSIAAREQAAQDEAKEKKREQIKENKKQGIPEEPPVLAERVALTTRHKFIIAGIALVVVSIGASIFTYFNSRNTAVPPTGNTLVNAPIKSNLHIPLVSVNESREYDATGKTGTHMLDAIDALKAETHPAGTLIELIPFRTTEDGKKIIPATSLLRELGLYVPEPLAQVLIPDMLIGVFFGTQPTPVIIIRGASRERLFPGLLAWEPTLATQANLFFKTISKEIGWADTLITNRDTRTQQGDGGLIYTFLDEQTVVLAPDKATISAIIGRELRIDKN